MLTQKGLIEFMRTNSQATNKEIMAHFNTDSDSVRTVIYRLKRKGVFDVQTIEGKRTITVTSPDTQKEDFKSMMLRDMCEMYYEDFLSAELYSERVEIGKMICRILDKI